MSTLSSLPPDILLYIFTHLATRKAFFTHVPLVCRLLRDVQRAILQATTAHASVVIHIGACPPFAIARHWAAVLQDVIGSSTSASINDAEQVARIATLRRKILRLSSTATRMRKRDPWSAYTLMCRLQLHILLEEIRDLHPSAAAQAIMTAFQDTMPFGNVRVRLLSFDGRHFGQIAWAAGVAKDLNAAIISLSLEAMFRTGGDVPPLLQFEKESLQTLSIPQIYAADMPLTALSLLIPHAWYLSTSASQKKTSTFRGPDGQVALHSNLTTLSLGYLHLLMLDTVQNLELAVQGGGFPRLSLVEVYYLHWDDDDPDGESVCRTLLVNLVGLRAVCPNLAVSVRALAREEQGFVKRFLEPDVEGLLRGLEVRRLDEPQVALQCGLGGGFCIWDLF
ncbi:hypothetical protein M427DRAFT_56431 [Gonapodya prolifera JEL478]|uniref:F-box domain-containing protein n=1 Tax=Gonapodya prolifera (strain JEL478) TaxID=1344416 RepID=A0A139AHD8_GONPJ|nr:hypothetical protein M427DRAFT_56431 [Gonapodya prolifera JEL478]|eukprot:KXS15855.1 hypothetical protein M427DRAFT_56431 [Gonapodya prolifera JEL478]